MESQNRNRSTWKPKSFAGAFCLCVILLATAFAHAQTTSFTYQGRFTDGGTAATGTYDMQFKLFDSASAGTQIGSTITNGAVTVNNGVFTVQLDYGATAFSGADRYLEIGVRLAGDANPYTILAPRQQLTSAVYAIRAGSATTADTATNASTATNATQLGGVDAGQYVQTNDSRLADARTPTAGSSNYIQNANSPQVANFNVSGTGTVGGLLSAGTVSAATQYNIGAKRVLSVAGGENIIVGINAGAVNTGFGNSFFGNSAGQANTSGGTNSFFGNSSGSKNLNGHNNSFFGADAGLSNETGYENSFFGRSAGTGNKTGRTNAFFGHSSGAGNTIGNNNSFFGSFAGLENSTGSDNSFFGWFAGHDNEGGSRLTLIGLRSNVASPALTNASAIGANAQVSQSNSLVLGSINGVNNASEDTNVGIGTSAPDYRLTVKTESKSYGVVHTDGTVTVGTFVNPSGGWFGTKSNHQLSFFVNDGGAAMTIDLSKVVHINSLGSGGSIELCLNASNQISKCGSSLRYKTNIQPFMSGLSVLNRLRPITFDWKDGGMHDLGFGAEEIAAVEPLLVTRNDKGQVEGVKYDRITAVLVNAVKEQQEQIKQQQSQIQSLKKLVCQRHRRAAVCK